MKSVKKGLFSKRELNDLLKAWLAISFAFGVIIGGFSFTTKFLYNFVLAALTVGIAFLAHELSHRTLARHYGCWAEFRSFDFMLLLAIIMSFFHFIFVIPGGVIISGPIGKRRSGKISASGPGSNIILSLIFLFFYLTMNLSGLAADIVKFGLLINTWLALFNLLPFFNFDGKKILDWNRTVYISMISVTVILLFAIGLV